MRKYFGLLSFVILFAGIILAFLQDPTVAIIPDLTFSTLGTLATSANIFNVATIISGITITLYFDHLISFFKLKRTNYVAILLYLSGLSLTGVGFFPYNLSHEMHFICAGGVFYITVIAFFFLARKFERKHIREARMVQTLSILAVVVENILFALIRQGIYAEIAYAVFYFAILVTLLKINSE